MRDWTWRVRKWMLVAVTVCLGAMSPLTYAQELSDFMEVEVSRSARGTGVRLARRDEYLALDEAPRTRGPLPARADISGRFPTPADQGTQQNCVAWAVGYAARSYYATRDNGGGDGARFENIVSPAYIYNTLNRSQGGGNDCQTAISIPDAINLLKVSGAVPLTLMRYRESDCVSQVSAKVLAAHAQRFRVQGSTRVDDAIAVKTQIYCGNPVIFVMHLIKKFDDQKLWEPSFFAGNHSFKSTTRDNRQHAMVITGYDDGRRAFKFMNSCSSQWGDKGFGWLDYQAANALWVEGYVMNVGAEQSALAPPLAPPREQQAVVSPPRVAVTTVADSLQSRTPGLTFRYC